MTIHWSEQFKNFFRVQLPEAPSRIRKGIYHYRREAGGNVTRFHLRVEEDGAGLLLANSSVAARLSPSGVLIAKSLLEGSTKAEVAQTVYENFRRVERSQLEKDLVKLTQFIETLANPEDNYPIFNLDDPSLIPAGRLFAPFHAQLDVGPACEVNALLNKLWDCGIVHVTFSATRDSSSEQAISNMERAEDIGMISGLRGVASWLQTPDLFRRAALAGVDYVVVPLLSHDAQRHDAFFGAGDFSLGLQCLHD